ncbi:MAG: hypothetical protein ABJC36_11560, partial [Gemmatimonadales bacterium]
AGAPAFATKSSDDEVTPVGHPMLTRINARLAAAHANVRIDKAEIRYEAKAYDAQSSTLIFANDRTHLIGSQWVAGDPRRDGRIGVTYAVDPELQTFLTGLSFPVPVIENGAGFRLSSQAELDGIIEETMQAWRDRQCSDAPIERVALAAGTDPDQLDDLFLGRPSPSPTYAQVADIIQAGWQPAEFFDALVPGGSDFILGVTFTFIFVDDQGTADEADDVPTDINGDGKLDTALAEIYYNPTFIWTTRGAPNTIDFYSVITHETGHSLGLAHFGKVFITKKDAADGLQIADVKYAPKALMNAVYVTGRDEIEGTDNGSFCQIWARK